MSNLIVGRGASPGGTNLVPDGSFVGTIEGWHSMINGSLLTYEDSETVVSDGSGSLALTKSGGGTAQATFRPAGKNGVSLAGLTELDFVAYFKRSGDASDIFVGVDWYTTANGTPRVGSPHAVGSFAVQSSWLGLAGRRIAIPEGAAYAQIYLDATLASGAVIYMDEIYLGAPFSPTSAAIDVALPANRIWNGDFESGISEWQGWYETEILTHDTAAPIAGAGSLKVETSAEGAGQGVQFPLNDNLGIPVNPGEAITVSFDIKGTGTLQATLVYGGAADPQIWTDTISGTPQTVSVDITVPSGAYNAYLQFLTVNEEAATFTIDNVSFGAPA